MIINIYAKNKFDQRSLSHSPRASQNVNILASLIPFWKKTKMSSSKQAARKISVDIHIILCLLQSITIHENAFYQDMHVS